MNNTLHNGLQLLEVLADTAKPYSVKELAENMELPPSHVHRLLRSLTQEGYVVQDAQTKQYRIAIRVLCLANACLQRLGIRSRVRPFLQTLARTCHAPVYLMAPHESGALVIDVIYPDGFEGDAALAIGGINPFHASAGGKVCAAHLIEEEQERILNENQFEKMTPDTLTDSASLREEWARVRADGLATTWGERGMNVNAAAAPVFDCDSQFIAAMGLVLPKGKRTDKRIARCLDALRTEAGNASYALGFARRTLVVKP